MNAPPLILSALLGTLALSAAKTLPADLRHDAKGKAPLTVTKMAAARGAGSTCRLGCNEPDKACYHVEGAYQDPDPTRPHISAKQTWNPHMECGYAWGSDTCSPLDDVECNTVFNYVYTGPDGVCPGPPSGAVVTTSSTCLIPESVPPVDMPEDPGSPGGDL